MKNKWIKSALLAVTVLLLTLVLEGCSSEQEKRETAAKARETAAKALARWRAEAKVPKAKALAVTQAAEAKVMAEANGAEKRLEWTGKAMQRAGMKAETVKRALTQGGTVVAWGRNDEGQTTVRDFPSLGDVVAIAAGGGHTVALKQIEDGTVVAWGHNGYGQTKVPAGLNGVVAIAAGGTHTVVLMAFKAGSVGAWGYNSDGQTTVPAGLRGDGRRDGQLDLSGGRIQTNAGVVAIAAGRSHTVALKQDGTVVAWGENDKGQTTVPAAVNVQLGDLWRVVAIAAGYSHTVALEQDGTVFAWGENDKGQTTVPAGLSGVVAIAAGSNHTVALRLD